MSETHVMNNRFRQQYRKLTEPEKQAMKKIKEGAAAFDDLLTTFCQPGRETAIARTNLETAVMWAVKGITG